MALELGTVAAGGKSLIDDVAIGGLVHAVALDSDVSVLKARVCQVVLDRTLELKREHKKNTHTHTMLNRNQKLGFVNPAS